MAKTTSVTLRMDAQLKRKSEQLFDELGLNMTTAVTVFLKTAVRQGKIPFEISYGKAELEQLTAELIPPTADPVPVLPPPASGATQPQHSDDSSAQPQQPAPQHTPSKSDTPPLQPPSPSNIQLELPDEPVWELDL